jgi:glycogen debranching enzyme
MANNADLIILDGCTFFYSNANGDVEERGPSGFFYRDVRHLTQWTLRVNGHEVEPLSSRRVDYYSARVVGTPGQDGTSAPISVRRDRFVTEGVHEDVVLENLTDEPREVRRELSYGADFADVMEAEANDKGEGKRWAETTSLSATLWNERESYRRGTKLRFNRKGRVTKGRAAFRVQLRAREKWKLCVDMIPLVDGAERPPLLRCDSFHDHAPKMPASLDGWLKEAPDLVTEHGPVRRTYRQSLLDLAALRVRPDDVKIKWAMPGGGLPWFMTIFGRDSIISAFQLLPFHAEPAQATLQALAELQATEWDSWRDAEPGKILHELRRGTLAATGKIPHTPYYGSHDSTPLWLILLDEYERWTGDVAFVRRMEPHARAALGWLEGPADLDGDGYIEYRKRSDSDKALDNHCWKDSDESIVFADGRPAEPPIAVCEHQGYAYDARLRTARLMREVWGDDDAAAGLEQRAADLKERFNTDFLCKSGRHYALALDGEKKQVDAMTSNVGHLLWSGIVDEDRAGPMVRRLFRDDMFSGWGIRSLSTENPSYNPLTYHNGTVWPHDNAIAAEGMRRYEYRDEAARLCEALIDAAEAFANRLPEVFAGFARDGAEMPIEYPDALKPQSWAAGAPLMAIRTLLGLDVVDGRLRARPCRSKKIGKLRLEGVSVRGERVDATPR